MTPAEAIAMLDGQLASHGQTLLLRRMVSTTDSYAEAVCRGRAVLAGSKQLADAARQMGSTFILSPTGINTAFTGGTWPAAAGGGKWPQANDFLVVNGTARAIVAVEPVILGDTVVRIVGRLEG